MSRSETLVRQWSRISTCHSKDDLRVLAVLVESGKAFLKRRAESFIKALDDRPLLMSYSGDGTPIKTKTSASFSSDGTTVIRCGSGSQEYYVHNCFLMCMSTDRKLSGVAILDEPRPMTNGKASPACASFAREMLPKPRELGHGGVLIRHLTFDRAMYSAVCRILRRVFVKEAIKYVNLQLDAPALLLYMLDWTVTTPCSFHDTHKSFFMGMRAYLSNEDLLKNTYIFIESLRNSYRLIMEQCPPWVWQVVTFKDPEELDNPDDLY